MAEKNYTIREGVHITPDVIATIAGLAATEPEGVAYLNGGLTNATVARAGASKVGKAVRIIDNADESITVQLIIAVKYGYTVLDVSKQVQEKVKSSIENMTDLSVKNVDVKVSGVQVGAAK